MGQATFHDEGTTEDDQVRAPRRWWVLVVRLVDQRRDARRALVARAASSASTSSCPIGTRDTAMFLALAAALTLAGIVLSTLRWRTVLSALGQDAKLRRLLSYNLAGLFVSNVLPTTIGGDVLRVSRLSKENGESAASFASVVLERLTGWLVLPVITLVGLLVNPGSAPPRKRHPGRGRAVASARSWRSAWSCSASPAAGSVRRSPAATVGGGSRPRCTSGWAGCAAIPAAAINVLVVGFAYQLVLVLAALMAAKAVGMSVAVGPTALLAFFPAVLIAQVLPISISGSACARVRSCCSSRRSACRRNRPSRSACCCTC